MPIDTSLAKGDYVKSDSGGTMGFGIIHDEGLEYEGGRYFEVEDGPNGSTHREVPQTILTKLASQAAQKEAVEQARQQGILQVALMLKEVQGKAAWAMSRVQGESGELPKPKTGIFVVVGVYSGNGPHRPYIAAVSADPETTEEQVSIRLKETHPNGFANIPGESRVLPGTSHGTLVDYWSYELPRQAAALIDWKLQQI